MNWIKNSLLTLTSIILTLIILEISLRYVPFVATPSRTQSVDNTSPIFHYKTNHTYVFARGWNGQIAHEHTTNNYGYNATIDFTENALTTCVIGDSYVEAMQVSHHKSFHAIMNDKGYNVYAIGMSGAPLSQYIRFAKWALQNSFCSDIWFIIIENDFDESIASYKLSRGVHSFDDLQDGKLIFTPMANPWYKVVLRESAIANYLYSNLQITRLWTDLEAIKPLHSDSSLEKSLLAIDYFFNELAKLPIDPSNILMVLDGDRSSIYQGAQKRTGENAKVYQQFQTVAKANSIDFIDLHPIFLEEYQDTRRLLNDENDYHWNQLGHAIVADTLIDYIERSQIADRSEN